jgi:hypothetical protein
VRPIFVTICLVFVGERERARAEYLRGCWILELRWVGSGLLGTDEGLVEAHAVDHDVVFILLRMHTALSSSCMPSHPILPCRPACQAPSAGEVLKNKHPL